ncbi:hypothetical protein [Rathayibacter sp. VKM Ac-2760]|uniref:hypothetical protein n=1 Tax=Rathayibacter sp. VKM Ac-2760 TaxID=2609253 RepID=UPI001317F8A4|nr:hypothetical protein [Rathayibacter sp. VKM Ac-2760]QHC58915.1 hypothetical protein GSU72_10410 [Rathayibacter sp. VKM Ac-2760]
MLTPYDDRGDFLAQAHEVTRAIVAEFDELPDESWVGLLRTFPENGCESASWVVGSILAELGFGDWVMVGRSDPAGSGRHVWLEQRDAAGGVRYTVDASIHQFDGFTELQTGRGALAAHARWPGREWETPIRTSARRYAHPVYAGPLAWTRERLL